MDNKEKAIDKLKKDLAKFKQDVVNDGWLEEEVDEKIAEVFENFHWYKYNNGKKSWKSYIFKFILYSLIIHLAFNALVENNKTFSSKYNDFMFGYQVHYHIQRYLRFFAMPIFRFYDLSKHLNGECLISNPFYVEDVSNCEFCEQIKGIQVIDIKNPNITNFMEKGEPLVLKNVPGYHNISVNFQSFKDLFAEFSNDLEKAICSLNVGDDIKTVSDYFRLTEEEIIQRNISITWTNCHTYGTRFYRRLFPRPLFIPNTSEIYFEKSVSFLQNGFTYENPDINQEGITFIVQVSGQSSFKMVTPDVCHSNCTTQNLSVQLNKGDIVVYTSTGWMSSLVTSSKELSIIYVSKFSRSF